MGLLQIYHCLPWFVEWCFAPAHFSQEEISAGSGAQGGGGLGPGGAAKHSGDAAARLPRSALGALTVTPKSGGVQLLTEVAK